jgi:NarL family two-component system response regulator LiaR
LRGWRKDETRLISAFPRVCRKAAREPTKGRSQRTVAAALSSRNAPQVMPLGFARKYLVLASADAVASIESKTVRVKRPMETRRIESSLASLASMVNFLAFQHEGGDDRQMGSAKRRSGSPISVLLVDEDAMTRRGVREILEEVGISIAGEARTSQEGIAQSVALEPDVVLMAMEMRGANGSETAKRICEAAPERRVLMLSGSNHSADADDALRAGACGYLLKDDSPQEIVAGVRAAAVGGLPLSPRVTGELLVHRRDGAGRGEAKPRLTAREQSVLELLATGRQNTQIADDLSISLSTVKRHVSNVFAKLGVENRTQAAVQATRRGLL